jgi:hypothetical protein
MYIPKNRIITNLKTNQGEFVYKDTNTPYNGFYWKSYDGKFFTGKNQNDPPINEIVKPVNSDTTLNPKNLPTVKINDVLNDTSNFDYISLKDINYFDPPRKFLPSQYYPTPTQDDYNLGAFSRYFVVKSNENIYLEVNKDTYDSINNQSTDWAWELYIPFTILWTLTGERDNVFITNRNITQLTEQRLKRRGLQEFLKRNYLKFYQTNEQNIS